MVSLPERSVMWTKVSLKEAKMCATPNTSSPSLTLSDQGSGRGHRGFRLITQFEKHTWGPRLTWTSSLASLFPFLGAMI